MLSMKSLYPTVLCLLLVNFGCATTPDPAPKKAESPPLDPEQLAIISSESDNTITWEALKQAANQADIIVIGEQHDDATAHRLQAALVKAVTGDGPVAVCMEMFERDEQPLVDAYLAGAIAKESLVETTDSGNWGGKGKWDAFYQPIVDAAKAAGAPVIAANAPRRFVRLARLENFDGLAALGAAYPAQFVVPDPIDQQDYEARFKNTMRHHGADPDDENAPPAMLDEKLEAMFRSQQVWDATMADSVVRAQANHGKAILMVGQFHTDYHGGLLLRMQAAAPDLRYLTVSVQKAQSASLREEDRDRADYVVYHPVGTDTPQPR